jgi:hypothetical protein
MLQYMVSVLTNLKLLLPQSRDIGSIKRAPKGALFLCLRSFKAGVMTMILALRGALILLLCSVCFALETVLGGLR